MSGIPYGKGSQYELCIKAGFSIIVLHEDYKRKAVWADEVERYLKEQETAALAGGTEALPRSDQAKAKGETP